MNTGHDAASIFIGSWIIKWRHKTRESNQARAGKNARSKSLFLKATWWSQKELRDFSFSESQLVLSSMNEPGDFFLEVSTWMHQMSLLIAL